MEPQVFLEWAEKIKGFSAAQLLDEAHTLFPAQGSNPLNAAPAVTALGLSGKSFKELNADKEGGSSLFLLNIREGLWRNAIANQHVIMPCDGSDFDARSHFRQLSSDGQFSSALRGCLTELALGSCNLGALFGSTNGDLSVGLSQKEKNEQVGRSEAAFLDHVAGEFQRQYGPMRNLKFMPRTLNPAAAPV